MAVSGLLAQYMAVKNQLNYNHMQQTRWNNMATAMSKKLSEQTSLEEKWESKSEDAYDAAPKTDKELSAGGTIFKTKESSYNSGRYGKKEQMASLYANAAVPKFDSDLLEEYTDLDMEYTTMQNMYDALCTELEAQEGALKEQVGKEAQDTHLLGGG